MIYTVVTLSVGETEDVPLDFNSERDAVRFLAKAEAHPGLTVVSYSDNIDVAAYRY